MQRKRDLQWSRRNERRFWKIGIKDEWLSSARRQVHGKCCIVLQVRSFVFFFVFCFLSSPFHFAQLLLLHLDPKLAPQYAPQGGQMRQVRCEKKELKDVHVPSKLPTWTLSNQPHVKSTTKKSVEEEEALEDWNREIGELFEWLGMACLGSQRFGFLFLQLSWK